MTPETLTDWATARPYVTAAAAGAFVLALLAVAWAARRPRRARIDRKRTPAAVVVTGIAAAACTAYSADTSWRFAKHSLDMADSAERAAFFAAGELVLFATALLARHNTLASGTPGSPGTLVWLITGVQVVAAYAEAGPLGGTVRAIVGPVFAALLWHLAMGVELRHRRPDADAGGFVALVGRDVRERALSRLGVVERDRDAAQITRDRWMARAVESAARLAVLEGKARGGRRGRRLERRLSKAIARAEVGTNEDQRGQLLAGLAARRHAARLAVVELPDPWERRAADEVHVPEGVPVPQPAPAVPTPAVLAERTARTRDEVRAEYVPDEDEHTVDARILFAESLRVGSVPSIRTLRERYSIGQARAQRIRDELGAGVRP
ncbi:hypothetical protein [Streptomyces synnematoformans]|uniref:DUF2637 domain-containing protein n=1 Tax=Streptomyces synnematoformans TaxID=415721 RepID=A0ABP5JKJ3_9ACTN